MNRRLGIIYFSDECYEDDLVHEMAHDLQLTPVNVTHEIWAGRYKWICTSPLFGVHFEGAELLVYTPSCKETVHRIREYSLA